MVTVSSRQAALARTCAFALILLLLSVLWSWQCLSAPSLARALWSFLASVPLLLPLPGILRGERRTYAWATLCLTPYFVTGISEAIVNASARPWAIAMLGLSVLTFFALIACLRLSPTAAR